MNCSRLAREKPTPWRDTPTRRNSGGSFLSPLRYTMPCKYLWAQAGSLRCLAYHLQRVKCATEGGTKTNVPKTGCDHESTACVVNAYTGALTSPEVQSVLRYLKYSPILEQRASVVPALTLCFRLAGLLPAYFAAHFRQDSPSGQRAVPRAGELPRNLQRRDS